MHEFLFCCCRCRRCLFNAYCSVSTVRFAGMVPAFMAICIADRHCQPAFAQWIQTIWCSLCVQHGMTATTETTHTHRRAKLIVQRSRIWNHCVQHHNLFVLNFLCVRTFDSITSLLQINSEFCVWYRSFQTSPSSYYRTYPFLCELWIFLEIICFCLNSPPNT